MLQLPAQKRQLLPYAIALLPPFVLQLFFKDLFFSALDYAGTYGVLVLFGVIPAAMAWQVSCTRFHASLQQTLRHLVLSKVGSDCVSICLQGRLCVSVRVLGRHHAGPT